MTSAISTRNLLEDNPSPAPPPDNEVPIVLPKYIFIPKITHLCRNQTSKTNFREHEKLKQLSAFGNKNKKKDKHGARQKKVLAR